MDELFQPSEVNSLSPQDQWAVDNEVSVWAPDGDQYQWEAVHRPTTTVNKANTKYGALQGLASKLKIEFPA